MQIDGDDGTPEPLALMLRAGATSRLSAISHTPALGAAALPKLIELLDDPDDTVRWAALAALGEIGAAGREAAAAVVRQLGWSEPAHVRWEAATTLRRMGDPTLAVIASLAEPGEEGRLAAVRRLESESRTDAVLEALRIASTDPNSRVQTEAERVLAGLPRPPVTETTAVSRERKGKFTPVDVFFATSRNDTGAAAPAERFGSERGGRVSYGVARVAIPAGRRIGTLPRPKWWKLEFRPNPERHIVLAAITSLDEAAFVERLSTELAVQQLDRAQQVLVFVHGFRVSFEDAALRAGQLHHDLGFPGIAAMFSWPSKGATAGYPADEATIGAAADDLKAFLALLAERTGAKGIHVIAHSMGNRALTEALEALALEHPAGAPLLHHVVLAAPDIDQDVFRKVVPKIRAAAARVTLYASNGDKALAVSRRLHQYPRAGEAGVNLLLLQGLDTIDASAIPTDYLGHSYFGDARPLVTDLASLIIHGLAPPRPTLEAVAVAAGTYWRFKA